MTSDRFKLTAKQERFCWLIVKGETNTNAYEQAGYSAASKEIAAVLGSRLLSNDKIQHRVSELRTALVEKNHYDLETATRDLMKIRDDSMRAGSYGPASQAVGLLCKLYGLIIERSEVTVQHRPAPLPTKVLELSEDEWLRQFGVEGKHRLLKGVKVK